MTDISKLDITIDERDGGILRSAFERCDSAQGGEESPSEPQPVEALGAQDAAGHQPAPASPPCEVAKVARHRATRPAVGADRPIPPELGRGPGRWATARQVAEHYADGTREASVREVARTNAVVVGCVRRTQFWGGVLGA